MIFYRLWIFILRSMRTIKQNKNSDMWLKVCTCLLFLYNLQVVVCVYWLLESENETYFVFVSRATRFMPYGFSSKWIVSSVLKCSNYFPHRSPPPPPPNRNMWLMSELSTVFSMSVFLSFCQRLRFLLNVHNLNNFCHIWSNSHEIDLLLDVSEDPFNICKCATDTEDVHEEDWYWKKNIIWQVNSVLNLAIFSLCSY